MEIEFESSIPTAKINQGSDTIHLSSLQPDQCKRKVTQSPFWSESEEVNIFWIQVFAFNPISITDTLLNFEDHDHYQDDGRSLSDVPSTTTNTATQ